MALLFIYVVYVTSALATECDIWISDEKILKKKGIKEQLVRPTFVQVVGWIQDYI